ncbi:unnamed protein product [Leptidea sinapis]|uniref:Uncharacterized protein n=1 Tax=Leptidea sinapis TaxID=189913 RepID=A0A5E4Q2G3_9NEOP|nr:unnamed protein product [Leptidea sinapis]
MDPVGPWSAYASYNRLAGVQAGAASGDFHHHLASSGTGLGSQSVPSTTSQLLLQAAHTTASLAGQLGSSTASPFNPGGFLSPPAVSYDAVFSPLFHHGNPKPAHYSSTLQHRQVIAQAQAQAQAAAASKQSSVETELSSLRENYSHQTLAAQGTFFDQPSTGSTAGLSWQGNNQLPSPFGILPHESVVPSSPSPATTKSAASYENFNAHFAATQNLNNHINSQIANTTKPTNRSGSPATASKQPVSSAPSTFFQSPSTFGNQTENSYSSNSSKSGQLSAQQDYAGKRANSASTVAPTSQQQNLNNSQDTSKVMDKKFNVPVTGPGSGFMASYLKFLQGERDTSPPPAGRGARKSTWSRTNTTSTVNNNKTYNTVDHTKSPCDANSSQQNANGAMAPSNPLNTVMPLSNPVLSSPVSMNTTGLLGSNQIHGSQSNLLGSQGKGVELDDPRYYNLNKERKRKFDGSDESSYDAEEEARRLNKPVLNVPSTPLNDKTKKSRSTAMNKPTPSAVVAPQPAAPKKPRPPAPPPVAPLQAAPQQQYYYQHQPEEVNPHATATGYGTYGSTDNDNSSRKLHNIKSHQQIAPGQIDNNRPIEEMPYQSGEFITLKSELNEMWPAMWRVDGKTLLQKFEPFEENGKVLYRNISTMIVILSRRECWRPRCIRRILRSTFKHEYFLSNVKTVDEVTETMRSRVSSGVLGNGGGARSIDAAVGTWPGLSVTAGNGTCRACSRPAVARLLLYGQPYNPGTLEPVQPDARLAYEKEFLVCTTCCGRVQLYSRISHQKYLMYAECSKRVAEKRMQNPRYMHV